jgi:glycosyltransferase involved in cell wall biosynthesis
MRIAHVTDCYLPRLGGIELHVHDLALRQRAAGHQVDILTTTAGEPTEGVQRFSGRSGAARTLDALLACGTYDVVHAHMSVLSPLAVSAGQAAARYRTPTLVTVHSMWNGLGHLPRWAAPVVGAPRWPVLWSAVSSAAADQVSLALGGETPVLIAPLGVDVGYWRSTAPRSADGVVTIASVMRFAVRKQPMALLRALREVRSLVPADVPLRAVVVGDGPLMPRAIRYLRRHAMTDWVRLTGRLTRAQIRTVLADSDVYVAPAERESFGLAAMEARCAGLPVVAMQAAGVRDFIAHGQEGLLAADHRELAVHLADLCRDAHLRSAMTLHNRTCAPAHDWGTVLQRTHNLYVAAGCRRPARSTVQVAAIRAPAH